MFWVRPRPRIDATPEYETTKILSDCPRLPGLNYARGSHAGSTGADEDPYMTVKPV